MKTKRLKEMEELILRQGSVSMEELREHFGVSMNTVRRDAASLVRKGQVEKVYGGLRAVSTPSLLVPYEERLARPDSAKRAICAAAAEMVHEGDIIFIDSGTTTVHLMNMLKDRRITVITNNIDVMMLALEHANIRLIVVPGELRRDTHSITGEASASFLSQFNTHMAFMAATGVSSNGDVTNSSPLEHAIKREAVAHTERAVLMVTSGKFDVTSLLTYANLNNFQQVITDSQITPAWREKLAEMKLDTVVVPAGD